MTFVRCQLWLRFSAAINKRRFHQLSDLLTENNNTTINNNNSSAAEDESGKKDRDSEKERSRGDNKDREKSDHKANSTSPKRPTSREFPPEREKAWNYPPGLDNIALATGAAFWQNYSGKLHFFYRATD